MTRIILLTSILCSSICVIAQTTLTVEVLLSQPAGGYLRAALCNSADGFKSGTEDGCFLKNVKTVGKTVTFTFENVPAATYALKIYQDIDGDQELGTNAIGIPNEPFGFSNNAMGRMGPPSFEQASFKMGTEPLMIKVKMRG